MLASTYSNYNDASLKSCNPENIRVQTPQGKPQRKYPEWGDLLAYGDSEVGCIGL